MSLTIKAIGLDWPYELNETVEKAIQLGMRSAAERARGQIVRGQRSVGAVDTGAMLRGWRVIVETAVGVIGGTRVVVLNDAAYAAVIEGGRRAGARMPPVEAIEQWLRRKGPKRAPKRAPRSGGRARHKRQAKVAAVKKRITKFLETDDERAVKAERKAVSAAKREVSRAKQAKQSAFVVARAIGRQGMTPRHIVATRIDDLADMAAAEVGREIVRALK